MLSSEHVQSKFHPKWGHSLKHVYLSLDPGVFCAVEHKMLQLFPLCISRKHHCCVVLQSFFHWSLSSSRSLPPCVHHHFTSFLQLLCPISLSVAQTHTHTHSHTHHSHHSMYPGLLPVLFPASMGSWGWVNEADRPDDAPPGEEHPKFLKPALSKSRVWHEIKAMWGCVNERRLKYLFWDLRLINNLHIYSHKEWNLSCFCASSSHLHRLLKQTKQESSQTWIWTESKHR